MEGAPENLDKTFEYKFLADPDQRKLLGEAMENVCDLVETRAEEEAHEEPNIIFLDKSARPLSTYFINLWNKKYPDKPHPQVSFLNIGRELQRATSDREEDSKDIDLILEGKELNDEISRIANEYAYLKNADPDTTVYVIDDVEKHGFTREISEKILQKAFPKLRFIYHPLVVDKTENHLKTSTSLFSQKDGTTQTPWSRYESFDFLPEDIYRTLQGVFQPEGVTLTSIPYYDLPEFQEGTKENEFIKSNQGVRPYSNRAWDLIWDLPTKVKKEDPEFNIINSLNNGDNDGLVKRLAYFNNPSVEIVQLRKELVQAADEYWEGKKRA